MRSKAESIIRSLNYLKSRTPHPCSSAGEQFSYVAYRDLILDNVIRVLLEDDDGSVHTTASPLSRDVRARSCDAQGAGPTGAGGNFSETSVIDEQQLATVALHRVFDAHKEMLRCRLQQAERESLYWKLRAADLETTTRTEGMEEGTAPAQMRDGVYGSGSELLLLHESYEHDDEDGARDVSSRLHEECQARSSASATCDRANAVGWISFVRYVMERYHAWFCYQADAMNELCLYKVNTVVTSLQSSYLCHRFSALFAHTPRAETGTDTRALAPFPVTSKLPCASISDARRTRCALDSVCVDCVTGCSSLPSLLDPATCFALRHSNSAKEHADTSKDTMCASLRPTDLPCYEAHRTHKQARYPTNALRCGTRSVQNDSCYTGTSGVACDGKVPSTRAQEPVLRSGKALACGSVCIAQAESNDRSDVGKAVVTVKESEEVIVGQSRGASMHRRSTSARTRDKAITTTTTTAMITATRHSIKSSQCTRDKLYDIRSMPVHARQSLARSN